ncbi:hypothetical protein [Kutzneria sp. NPDC051319]|uniref:hypothetical protein n=1 Tax=Kutzneria sp. NPDC051319 TaxID=3155047 RepID=UPI0034240F7E
MTTQENTEQPTGGFSVDPMEAGAQASKGGCCGEPADSAGAVPGGQSGGCCGEPTAS